MIVGYARASSRDQRLDVQRAALVAGGAENIFEEKMSGTRADNRDQLQACLNFVRDGDVLIVSRLDRLARSMVDLHNIIAQLEKKGVGFRCTEQAIDTTTSTGRLTLGILGAVAQFETEIRRERQTEGIAKAKLRNVYKGRPHEIDAMKVHELDANNWSAADIAKELRCGVSSVYRLLKVEPHTIYRNAGK